VGKKIVGQPVSGKHLSATDNANKGCERSGRGEGGKYRRKRIAVLEDKTYHEGGEGRREAAAEGNPPHLTGDKHAKLTDPELEKKGDQGGRIKGWRFCKLFSDFANRRMTRPALNRKSKSEKFVAFADREKKGALRKGLKNGGTNGIDNTGGQKRGKTLSCTKNEAKIFAGRRREPGGTRMQAKTTNGQGLKGGGGTRLGTRDFCPSTEPGEEGGGGGG